MNTTEHQGIASEQPFPISSLFRRRFIPAFMGFTALFLLLLGLTAQHVIEQIYLELAQRRAQTIARAVAVNAPESWAHLMGGRTLADLQDTTDAAILKKAFTDEVREMNLSELKVYDLASKVLFATNYDEIGSTENGPALRRTIDHSVPNIVTKTLPDGTSQYELYVPVFDDSNQLRPVFELYEPVSYLNAILLNAAVPTMAVPAGLLMLLIGALNMLVGRAQKDIDARTHALRALQERLSSFVSDTAKHAARSATRDGDIPSLKTETTLFYSDIRDFTGFSEQNTPETVVGFLNRIMSLQVAAVQDQGGDVDKMIGDAVLARFDGDDGGERAINAAKRIQKAIREGDYPRAIGIGIHKGEVISGAIGPADRRDFTVIGDAVNISARLCSLAKANEIVVDAQLADETFGNVETVQVKGRVQGIDIRKYQN